MRFWLASLVLLLVLTSRAGAADPGTEEAKAIVRKATADYNLGRYLEAAKEYEAAYEKTLDAKLLFNVAQAYRLGGDREKAITTYRSFIRSDPKSELRGLAETKLRELEHQQPSTSPAQTVAPIPPPVAAAPTAAVATSPPALPDPIGSTSAPGPAPGASPPSATATLVAPAAPAGIGRGVVVGAVLTGTLAVGAVVTGVLYTGKLNDYNTANDQLAANRADLRSQTNTLGAVNLALVGGALVAAGVTVILWTRGRASHDATSARVELRGVVTPTLTTLSLTGSL